MRTTGLDSQFSLNIYAYELSDRCFVFNCIVIRTLFEKNAFQEGILVSQHETFISCTAMSSLQVVKISLMDANGFFKLLDVLGSAFSKSRLSLTIALLAFFGSCVDLCKVSISTKLYI